MFIQKNLTLYIIKTVFIQKSLILYITKSVWQQKNLILYIIKALWHQTTHFQESNPLKPLVLLKKAGERTREELLWIIFFENNAS